VKAPVGHAGERALWHRTLVLLGIPSLVLLPLFFYSLYLRGSIPPWLLVILVLLSPVFIYAFARVLYASISGSAERLTAMMYGAGNLTPDPAHSGMESLVARGRYAEAAEAFGQWIVEHPADHGARIKLADLSRRHLDGAATAERLYLEVRAGNPAPREEMLASNLLIELYRDTGRSDRLVVELARFADRYRGSRAGRSAAEALKQLKEERNRLEG